MGLCESRAVLSVINNYNITDIMKNFKRPHYLFVIAFSMALLSCSSGKEFIPFGQPDVDRVRKEVRATPTDSVNFDERVNTLSLWMRYMMFYGADIHIDRKKQWSPDLRLNSIH